MKNIYTIILLLFISLFNNGFSQPQTVTFNYTGAAQTWTVPPCVYNISVSVKGAQGGGPGGLGATVLNPTIAVTPGQVLQINVGQCPTGPIGGWNGGGNGFAAVPVNYQSFGGGGASDIRTTPYALTNRIVVAGGGGGKNGCSPQYNALGGGGGCVTGMTGAGSPFVGVGGGGGTATAGGNGGPPWGGGQPGVAGTLGNGGNGGFYSTASGGGGGGGRYGGGGGGADNCCTGANGGGGGGGGSSLNPAGGTCTQGNNTGNGVVAITFTAGSVSITTSNTGPYCEGSTIQLNATTGASSYSWAGPNGFTSNVISPSIPNITSAAAGTYTLTVGTPACGNVVSTVAVAVNPTPTLNVTPVTVCNGAPATLTATSNIANGVYTWTLGGVTVGTGPTLTVSPTVLTTYTVGYSVNGCTPVSTTVTVLVAVPVFSSASVAEYVIV